MDRAHRDILVRALPRLRGRYTSGRVAPVIRPVGSHDTGGGTTTVGASLAGLAGDAELPDRPGQHFTLHDADLGMTIEIRDGEQPDAERPLSGRTVAVTGAGSGIGREIAKAFSAAGARVVALDINLQSLSALEREIGCRVIACDVTSDGDVTRAFGDLVMAEGGLDILVTNAGAAWQGAIADVPLADLQRSFDLNFFGHQRCCQEAVAIFRRQGTGGVILFNISNQSVNPGRHFGSYGIPKAATLALMKQYAVDHSREGIRVCGVNAGRIRTGLLTDDVISQRATARGISVEQYMAGNLMGLEVRAADIADAFLHLALMDKVNAAVLTVDGGDMATALR